MSLTPSTMMPLGTKAPNFELMDTISGQTKSLLSLRSDIATAILFICNHCPYVKHIQTQLSEVAKTYQAKGIQFIAINSNDAEAYTEDNPDNMKLSAEQNGYRFPYLFDETQEVASAYDAACTPDIFVFDKDLLCVYRGQFDDTRPNSNQSATGRSLTDALDAMLSGQEIASDQQPSVGCNIKWKKQSL